MNCGLKKILSLIAGTVTCVINGDNKTFATGQEALQKLDEKHIIKSIYAEGGAVFLVLEEDGAIANDIDADWVKEHIEKYGVEPNLFDGV